MAACFGHDVVFRDLAGSTNDEAAVALSARPVPEGTVFLARQQARGRGAGGSVWYSDEDGLYFSLVLHEPLRLRPLSFLPGIALVDLLREELLLPAELKWPNDVLLEGRKLGGVLVESCPTAAGGVAWIVGVGVNVNQQQFPEPIAEKAVSLRMATGSRHDVTALLVPLLERMQRLYDGGADLVELWPARSRMIGARISARRRGAKLIATVLGLSDEGHLRVLLDDGSAEEWVSSSGLEIRLGPSRP